MNIIVTGSLGHISKPLTIALVKKGHAVTVISSDPGKQKAIEELGAIAAIGSLDDVPFLIKTFTGADAVYSMTPPTYTEHDHYAYSVRIADNYAAAFRQSGVKRVVHLSSFGADIDKGTGNILGKYYNERLLNSLPGLMVTHMRAVYFYYNLLSFIDMIKYDGIIRANYGADDKIPLASPVDIAAAVADEIVKPAAENKIQYIASDERTGHEIAAILGAAIGKPDLKWEIISDEETRQGLEAHGVPAKVAGNLVEMMACLHSGALARDYYLNQPQLGHVKLTDFAPEFAAAYHSK